MRIGVVGINYKLADLKLREQLARACLKCFGTHRTANPPHYFILLSTCNRTEIYFQSEDLAATHTHILGILREHVADDFDQKLYCYFGQDCLLHLCRVTTGLDSAIVAETEIQGQVKAAYECATQFASLPQELHYLFQKSLKIGKQVRSELPIQRGLPDVEHAILQTATHLFPRSNQAKILLVGASAINRKILKFFKTKQLYDITICNRTDILACEIANTYACNSLIWSQLHTAWHAFDWIIFGTKAPQPIIDSHSLPLNNFGRKLIIDLSVPRNVDTNLGKDPRITLLNIDQLNRTLSFRRKQIQHILTQAENLIELAAKQHNDNFKQRQQSRKEWLTAV